MVYAESPKDLLYLILGEGLGPRRARGGPTRYMWIQLSTNNNTNNFLWLQWIETLKAQGRLPMALCAVKTEPTGHGPGATSEMV